MVPHSRIANPMIVAISDCDPNWGLEKTIHVYNTYAYIYIYITCIFLFEIYLILFVITILVQRSIIASHYICCLAHYSKKKEKNNSLTKLHATLVPPSLSLQCQGKTTNFLYERKQEILYHKKRPKELKEICARFLHR